MVPPASPPDDHADPAWLAQIRSLLRLNKGGVVVGLEGAHPARVGPLIERLGEGGATVRVCFAARELLEAPEDARVVLLHAARDAEFLNLARPIVAERRLRVFVWLQPGDRRELRRRARDFLDWMQETIDVPPLQTTGSAAEPLDWEVASAWLAEAGVAEPRMEAARLHLDPIEIARRTGRESPSPRALAEAASHRLQVYFPSRSVTLTTELDSAGELEVRYEGILLQYYDGLEIIENPSLLPMMIEIRNPYGPAGDDVRLEARTFGADGSVEAWSRSSDGCHAFFPATHGTVDVEIIATSGDKTSAARLPLMVKSAAGGTEPAASSP